MNMKNYIIVLFLASNLFACQSTEVESIQVGSNGCVNNNWTQIGTEIAQSGKSVRTFLKYKERCPDITLDDKTAYLEGYTLGIKEYCTFANGFKVGYEGGENIIVCPIEMRSAYKKGFDKGTKNLGLIKDKLKRDGESQLERQATARTKD
jgi:hypothetical protein|tara:strand:+ start:1504 stop:1953 length:450 start_codon:yes stop_codon:yes gene_type:complete